MSRWGSWVIATALNLISGICASTSDERFAKFALSGNPL